MRLVFVEILLERSFSIMERWYQRIGTSKPRECVKRVLLDLQFSNLGQFYVAACSIILESNATR